MFQQTFDTEVRQLAYNQTEGDGPAIVFLGGFNSNKEGIKATHLENWARRQGRAYLRFDYSGHGASSGAFRDGSISDWAEDAAMIVNGLTKGPQVLVGSSMGGWIALLLARLMPTRIAGLVTIAGAPDFTQYKYQASLTDLQKAELSLNGFIEIPSSYGDGPYVITQKLIEDGARNLIFDKPLHLPFPTRILHGSADKDVSPNVARQLYDHATGPDICMNLVRGADHRFSTPDCLALIEAAIAEVS